MDAWHGQTRFEIGRKLLSNIIDSIERSNPNIEFGLRVYGHQSPKSNHNCQDSRLEVPFGKSNASKIKQVLYSITPQGWTPIAYSLFEATRDFPVDPDAKNAIILITDGLESCDGDPCAVATLLQRNRIAMKPFIIGMGLDNSAIKYFDCVGTYYDASNAEAFTNTLNVVVSQALNTTSLQVNLLDQYGKPTETNIEMTFYDAYSGEVRYNYVHTFNDKSEPDWLYPDPIGKYNLTVHTTPPVTVKNIELTPGKHNMVAADVPQGIMNLIIQGGNFGFSRLQSIIRRKGSDEILYIQDFGTSNKYLTGDYTLEILTTPRLYEDVSLVQNKVSEVSIPKPGIVAIASSKQAIAGVFYYRNNQLEKVFESKDILGTQQVSLQPGEYQIVYRPNKERQASLTETRNVTVISGRTINVNF